MFHILTTDNFDNNVPGGAGEAIHTLASLVAIPNPVISVLTVICHFVMVERNMNSRPGTGHHGSDQLPLEQPLEAWGTPP